MTIRKFCELFSATCDVATFDEREKFDELREVLQGLLLFFSRDLEEAEGVANEASFDCDALRFFDCDGGRTRKFCELWEEFEKFDELRDLLRGLLRGVNEDAVAREWLCCGAGRRRFLEDDTRKFCELCEDL